MSQEPPRAQHVSCPMLSLDVRHLLLAPSQHHKVRITTSPFFLSKVQIDYNLSNFSHLGYLDCHQFLSLQIKSQTWKKAGRKQRQRARRASVHAIVLSKTLRQNTAPRSARLLITASWPQATRLQMPSYNLCFSDEETDQRRFRNLSQVSSKSRE